MKNLLKVALRYGIVAAIIGSGILVALYYMGRHPLLIPWYIDFRIFLFAIFIFFALREIRDYYQKGVLYFSHGIFASLVFTVTYAVLSSLAIYGFTALVPEFLTDYIELSLQQLKSFPPSEIEKGKDVYLKALAALPSTEAADLALLYFVQSFGISVVLSIILSVILRRQPKT